MYVYHYHAEFHDGGSIQSIDGIAWLTEPIRGMVTYHKLKNVIVWGSAMTAEKLIVRSVTPLGEIDGVGDVNDF